MRLVSYVFIILSCFSLVACNGETDSSPPFNHAPVASAGVDQNVEIGALVTLNGSASTDTDGDLISYQWLMISAPENSIASLNNVTIVNPTFNADIVGIYEIELVVDDGAYIGYDYVTIIVSALNSAPMANAGVDQNVGLATLVTLDGRASSDADGNSLTYHWSFISIPGGSEASFNDAEIFNPEFSTDIEGSYVIELLVDDGAEQSNPDTVTIVASVLNLVPDANAGVDQNVGIGTLVTLDGSASNDADGDSISYQWSFVSIPTGSIASFDDSQVFNPGFSADIEGSYVIDLVVNDGLVSSVVDTVVVNAIQPRVLLFKDTGGFFGSSFSAVSLPFSSSTTLSVNVTGIPAPTTYSLGTFKLVAEGQDFTVINLSAFDGSSWVVPYFDGLSEGTIITDGTEVTFNLVSPLTGGPQVNLAFDFEVQETGEMFAASYAFTSN